MVRGKGFSLIELLVVLVVIGVLIAMILPNALKAIDMANVKDCAANIRSIDTAIQMYYIENSRTWPLAVANVATYISGGVIPVCKVTGVAYTLGTDGGPASGDLNSIDRTAHFTTFPDVHL